MYSRHILFACTLVTLYALFSSSGCVGTMAQLANVWNDGIRADAEFDDLKGKRVAIVCVSDASLYGLDRASEMLGGNLELILRKEVKGIKLVRQAEVLDWIDNNDWNKIDFSEIGRGVGAELLIAVELSSYRLNNGSTLFQGHADVTTSVYDVTNNGVLVFRQTLPSFQFPKNGGRSITDMNQARFEQQFIHMLSQKIANYFYDYELPNEFASDAAMLE